MKLFTVEEANSLLPTVRRIVKSIQKSHHRLIGFQTAAKQAALGAENGGGGIVDGPRYAQLLVNLSTHAGELESLGIQLKDYHQGLIDFPSMRDGRVVLLAGRQTKAIRLNGGTTSKTGLRGDSRCKRQKLQIEK